MLFVCLTIAFAADPSPEPPPKKETREQLTKRLIALPAKALKGAKTDAGLIEVLFKETLNRSPKPEESTAGANHLIRAKDREAATRNLVWALVNTKEFAALHGIPVGDMPGLSERLAKEWAARK